MLLLLLVLRSWIEVSIFFTPGKPRAGEPSALWLYLSHCRASVTGSTQVHTLGAVRRAVWPTVLQSTQYYKVLQYYKY